MVSRASRSGHLRSSKARSRSRRGRLPRATRTALTAVVVVRSLLGPTRSRKRRRARARDGDRQTSGALFASEASRVSIAERPNRVITGTRPSADCWLTPRSRWSATTSALTWWPSSALSSLSLSSVASSVAGWLAGTSAPRSRKSAMMGPRFSMAQEVETKISLPSRNPVTSVCTRIDTRLDRASNRGRTMPPLSWISSASPSSAAAYL